MISKTPRTDRQPVVTVAFQQFVKAGFARQLERQLAGANKRIKELEVKVDELHDLKKWLEGR
jgi:type II secretory pathway predicted ATPase ExeA